MKKLYEYNGRTYKFNNAKFADLFMPDNLDMSRAKRKKDMIQKEDLATTEQAVEAWYKNLSSPSDICMVEQIAHYLDVDVKKLLIETDEIMEHIKEASSISERQTIEAFAEHLIDLIISTPADNPNFMPNNFFKRILGYIPKGLPFILVINICMLWISTLDMDTLIKIGPFILLIGISMLRFARFSYFKKKSKFLKILNLLGKLIQLNCLYMMLKQIYFYIILHY